MNLLKSSLVVVFSILMAACASSSKTYTPNGGVGYNIDCSGTARNWGMCYEKAGELCKEKGYDIIHQSGEHGNATSGYAGAYNSNIFGSSLHFRTMTISCKP